MATWWPHRGLKTRRRVGIGKEDLAIRRPRKEPCFEMTQGTQTRCGACYVWRVVDVVSAGDDTGGGGCRMVLWVPCNCRTSVGPCRTTGNSTAGRSDGWRIRVHRIVRGRHGRRAKQQSGGMEKVV